MQVAVMERRRREFGGLGSRFMATDGGDPLPVVHVPVDAKANAKANDASTKTIWDTDVRYQRYCDWCTGLGIRPAEFEFWWRLAG